jgi:hypothetical protein
VIISFFIDDHNLPKVSICRFFVASVCFLPLTNKKDRKFPTEMRQAWNKESRMNAQQEEATSK